MNDIVSRFLDLNNARLKKTLEIMTARQRPLLTILPILFHINDASLPGFVSDAVPSGIYGFTADDKSQAALKKIWRKFHYRPKPFVTFDIEAIFLMGSCGTIAFNAESDFDAWVCYRSGMNKNQLKLLQAKASEIESWYEQKGLEVHIFLMNADAFKRGRVTRLSSESSGSAQYHLLLDEFYRTSIWLAGKKPLWWLIAPEKEAKYEKTKKYLIENELINENECIDFGGLAAIPKGEFFGAAVWQIYKGIDSPYKSVLKITLMEAYAESYPEIEPLSAHFKKRVYAGETDSIALDAYLLLFSRVESYLRRKSELSRLEVARRSFYLKLSLPVSKPVEAKSWRNKYIEDLVFNQWCWKVEKTERLDDSKNWSIEDIIGERKLLVGHLTNSYKTLSDFARKHASRRLIKPKDLTILGRKLYAAFDRKAGKVEIFNRGIADNIAEKNLTVKLVYRKDSQDFWQLFRGKVSGDQYRERKSVKQSFSLIELLVWCQVNKLTSDETHFLVNAPGVNFDNKELNSLLPVVREVIGQGKSLMSVSKDLLKPAVIIAGSIFLNIAHKPQAMSASFNDKIASGQIDVLNFGSEQSCLVHSIDHLYITSWKEIFVFKYSNVDGLAEWLCSALNLHDESLEQTDEQLKISAGFYSFGTSLSQFISARISALHEAVVGCLLIAGSRGGIYVYKAGKHFFCISCEADHFDFVKLSSIEHLLAHLALVKKEFYSVHFDAYMKMDLPLPEIYQKNVAGKVQVFCYAVKTKIHLFILDEKGALHYQELPYDDVTRVLMHYERFLSTVLSRKNIDEVDWESAALSAFADDLVETYQVLGHAEHFTIDPVSLFLEKRNNPLQIQALVEQVDNKTAFTFYCDDVEFSSAEYGSRIFEKVASTILKRRSGHQRYYLYITDLELSPTLSGKKTSHKVELMELMSYKKRIETELNKNLYG